MNDAPFDGGAPSPSLGLNAAYQAAFNDYMAAGTPQAKNEALGRMEAAAIAGSSGNGGGRGAAPSSAPSTGPSGASVPLMERQDYRDLLAKVQAAPTPQARDHWLRQMEAMAQEASASSPATAQGETLEGLEPAASIGELKPPAELAPHIADAAAFDQVREAAVAVGLPAVVFSEAMSQAHENLHLLKASDAEWNSHLDGVFAQLDRAHGSPEARSAVVKDAAAFLNAVADADPRLIEATDLMRASAWGLSTAAALHRAGIRPGKR